MTDRNQAVFFAGEKEDVVRKGKITDGGMGGKLSNFRSVAPRRRTVSATFMGQSEDLFEELMVMRDEKKARGNIVDDIPRDKTLEWGSSRKKLRSAGGNRPEEDEFAID